MYAPDTPDGSCGRRKFYYPLPSTKYQDQDPDPDPDPEGDRDEPASLCNHVSYYACILSLIYCTKYAVQGGSAQSISKIICCSPTVPYCRAGRGERELPWASTATIQFQQTKQSPGSSTYTAQQEIILFDSVQSSAESINLVARMLSFGSFSFLVLLLSAGSSALHKQTQSPEMMGSWGSCVQYSTNRSPLPAVIDRYLR